MPSHRTRKAGRGHSKKHHGGYMGVVKQASVPLALLAMNHHAKKHRTKKHGGKRSHKKRSHKKRSHKKRSHKKRH